MKSVYDTCTKDKVKVSYSLYAMLIELGLNPSNFIFSSYLIIIF